MDKETTFVAPRTCTVVDEGESNRDAKKSAKPLINYADASAYVLIGEPGAGKTTSFKSEAGNQGGVYVPVRKFLTFDEQPEWQGKTLFLDGLDESRVGTVDGRTPLDRIRTKLDRLDRPKFRLSCRWADWFGSNDRDRLKEVSSDGTVTVVRIDPLSKQNINDILNKKYSIEAADDFIGKARERGIDGLLKNPQNLDLLVKSVSRGKWPKSRKETFEQACRMLVCEPNREHRLAKQWSAETGPLIEAAGRLCVVQLFSGVAGFTLPDRAVPDSDYPSLVEVDRKAGGRTRDVLGTRLFVGASEGKLSPTHRQIAEFLAARHVSGLVDGGLPLERILALITGFDGELLPSFQNFASWLAVHNKRSRKRLSRLDPSGLIYAGDRQTYSTDEKRDIVLNLRRESCWNPWCNRSISKVPGIGKIVSPELKEVFREVLTDGERARKHQSYVMLLMQMLADGEPLPALSDVLEQMVRDRTWNQGVRSAALDVLSGYHARGQLESTALTGMVAEIEDGSLDDPQDELLGILLKALYPKVLSIAEVQRYLRKPKLVAITSEYARFWTEHVPNESTPEQLADLMDGIAERFTKYRPFMVGDVGLHTGLGQLPVKLLNNVLRETRWRNPGRTVASDRLFEWLGVVSDPGLRFPKSDKVIVKFDLQWNAETLKALIAYGVETCLRRGEECLDLVDRRLFGARPFAYARWCLEMALATGQGKVANFYLHELSGCVMEGACADGLTLEEARVSLAVDAVLATQFDDMVERRTRAKFRTASRTVSAAPADTESLGDTRQQQAWQARIAAQASALRAGRGSPRLLCKAAEAYLGIHGDSGEKAPRDRLHNLVGRREDLIDLLVLGMEGTITRGDLPGCDDMVRLFDRKRVNSLVLPFVAGLHSLEQAGRLSLGDLNESQTRLGVAILYTLPRECVEPNTSGQTGTYRPEWFRALLRDEPALVADVLRGTVAKKLETGVQPATELQEMAKAEDHREVAAIASLPVLEHFPTAQTDAALLALCWSLKAALERCDWSDVGRLIEERLRTGDQLPGERSCWLTAGYLVAPERYRDDLRGLGEHEEGLKWLAMFVSTAGRFPERFTRRFAPADFEPLVAALGAELRLHGLPEKAYWSTSDLIVTLSSDPSAAATDALEKLSRVSDAEPWEPAIAEAKERQALKRREHEYRQSDIAKVVQTLDRGTPANAGDLAALVFNELKALSLKIRNGGTSDWRQHWNTDRYKRPKDPKHEDLCRDAVLSDLQERLAGLGIDAQPEGVYAEDKRSDIRVSFAEFNVPVEIKRSCHPDLWTAVRSQLIAKYTRDPGAEGYGIYLVFWFGDTEECLPTKWGNWVPETAEDVRLKIEQSLDDREGRLISICVVDVSTPR